MKGIVGGRCNIPRHACRWCRAHPGESGFPRDCPEGYRTDRLPILLGNVVEKALRTVTPKRLKGCRGCGKRKKALNMAGAWVVERLRAMLGR